MGLLINENEFTSKSTSSKLIGETFTTLRTGIIDGAVEQDGSQYNFSDYPEIETLLKNGDLPYITINEFDAMVTNQGGCDSFGYNSGGKFYGWNTPMYGGNFYTKSQIPQTGDDLYQNIDNNMVVVGTVYGYSETYGVQIDGDGHYAGRESSLDETIIPLSYFKVPKKTGRVLVRSRKPSTNNYSWYNVYSDGWVE